MKLRRPFKNARKYTGTRWWKAYVKCVICMKIYSTSMYFHVFWPKQRKHARKLISRPLKKREKTHRNLLLGRLRKMRDFHKCPTKKHVFSRIFVYVDVSFMYFGLFGWGLNVCVILWLCAAQRMTRLRARSARKRVKNGVVVSAFAAQAACCTVSQPTRIKNSRHYSA